MLNEKKVVDKLTEIVGLMKDLRMDFFLAVSRRCQRG